MRRTCFALALGLAIALPVPALAAPAPVEREPARLGYAPVLGPLTAPLASLLAPVGVAGVAFAFQTPVLGALAPMAMGTGQVLAGDPWRGACVGAGSYAVGAGTWGLTWGLMVLARGPGNAGKDAAYDWLVAVIPGLAALAGYWIWASLDAGTTSMREQIRRMEPPEPF